MKPVLCLKESGHIDKAIKMGKTYRIHFLFKALIYYSILILVILSFGVSLRTYSLSRPTNYLLSSSSPVPHFTNYILHGPNISEIGPSFTYPTSINDAPLHLLHYLTWHAKQMDCIRNSSCYEREKSKLKIMVWECPLRRAFPCAGMGDRFRGIVSSMVLSMITGHIFLLNWPNKPYPFYHAVSPAAIDWRVPGYVLRDSEDWGTLSASSYPRLEWKKCPPGYYCASQTLFLLSDAQRNRKQGIQTFQNLTDPKTYHALESIQHFVMLSRATYSHMLIKRPEWTAKYGDSLIYNTNPDLYLHRFLLRTLFKPSPITQIIIGSVLKSTVLGDGYWSIHARTGQDVSESSLRRFENMSAADDQLVLANRFMRCILQLKEELDDLNATTRLPLFVSSDSIALKKALADVAEKYGVKIIFINAPSMHIGSKFMKNRERWGTSGSLPINGPSWLSFINTYVDFFLLANGTVSVSNKSEFSRLAFVLSNGQTFRSFDARRGVPHEQCKLEEMDIPILRLHASKGIQ